MAAVSFFMLLYMTNNTFNGERRRNHFELAHVGDLSMNNLSHLEPGAFSHLGKLTELRLGHNALSSLRLGVFDGLAKLHELQLQENPFKSVPVGAFLPLPSLQKLHLDSCQLEKVADESFSELPNLMELWLDGNRLKIIPSEALNNAPTIRALTLASNQLAEVANYAFVNLTQLEVLLLFENRISFIGDHAFEGLSKLKVLEMDRNMLSEIPVALASLPGLVDLMMSENKIEYLPDNSFIGNKKLNKLNLKNNPIMSVGKYAFTNLPQLENLVLSEARDQEEFPDLTGTHNLMTLHLDRGSIKYVPKDLCEKVWRLRGFDVHSNRLTEIPDLSGCKGLLNLNLGNNEITSLEKRPFAGMSQLRDLTLSDNYIQYIPEQAFDGLTSLQYLDLQHNKISDIHPEAFALLTNLEDLNLGENVFSHLPTKGLKGLKNLKTFNNRYLQDIPPPETFPRIHILALSYAYHCCEFVTAEEEETHDLGLDEEITWLSKDFDNDIWRNLTNIWGELGENLSSNYQSFSEDVYEAFGTDYDFHYPENIPSSAAHYFSDYKPKYDAQDFYIAKPPISCKPMPGPFMPCDDLMGWWSLRCGVWVVFLLALLGNGCVLLVSLLSRSKMDVPRFLICNLACADFFMGIYLGFLAIVDASTLGDFKKHAIQWQTSAGCQVAGFLGVLSSELSVFTLTLITLERFYAITHAMHLNKRLSIRHAGYIMACGWFLAVLLASMPLFGVSDYRKFAVCLPFEIGDKVSLGYVCFIMLINCIAFCIIVSCYMKMYCSIRGSQAWNSNDTRVAKRMALLVFTDFACWAPISFFSLTAAFGLELISLNDAKVFTIFVLPLNSCANPFLYAIFTKQFKKDCSLICKRIEESAMSRSLSRFSNRHFSLTWGSSRHPSALNSFFASDNSNKRQSRSNSISGASAGHLENNADSMGGPSSKSSSHGYYHRGNDDHQRMIGLPATRGTSCFCSCISSKANPGSLPMINCPNNVHITVNGQQMKHVINGDNLHEGYDLDLVGRGAPVGAGARFLSLLKQKKGIDKLGDGMDSDQEDGVWLRGGSLYDHLGIYPLIALGDSPGEPPKSTSNDNSTHSSPVIRWPKSNKSKSPSPTGSRMKPMLLNCCNGSPHEVEHQSPSPGYHLMKPGEDISTDLSDSVFRSNFESKDESTTSDMDGIYNNHALVNNNHDYMNLTEDIITELQKIRNSSSNSDSSGTAYTAPEPSIEADTMDVRLDPEGSESKEKPAYVKVSAASVAPKIRHCQCKNPMCCDKEESPANLTPGSADDGSPSDGVDMPTNRDSWILGTGRSLSPYLPVGLSARAAYRLNLQKSNSFDCDSHLYNPQPVNLASTSMPVLSPGSLSQDDPCLACTASHLNARYGPTSQSDDSENKMHDVSTHQSNIHNSMFHSLANCLDTDDDSDMNDTPPICYRGGNVTIFAHRLTPEIHTPDIHTPDFHTPNCHTPSASSEDLHKFNTQVVYKQRGTMPKVVLHRSQSVDENSEVTI